MNAYALHFLFYEAFKDIVAAEHADHYTATSLFPATEGTTCTLATKQEFRVRLFMRCHANMNKPSTERILTKQTLKSTSAMV